MITIQEVLILQCPDKIQDYIQGIARIIPIFMLYKECLWHQIMAIPDYIQYLIDICKPNDMILTLITSILGCTTLMTSILYYSATRRAKNAEALKAEVEAEDAHITGLIKSLQAIEVLLSNTITEFQKELTDKTNQIRQVNATCFELQQQMTVKETELARLNLLLNWHRQWHCTREYPHDCDRRLPTPEHPLVYMQIDKNINVG